MKQYLILFFSLVFAAACNTKELETDAAGTFEAEEVVVSSELSGKLVSFDVREGALIAKDSVVGIIDAANLSLQKEQVEASIQSLRERTLDVSPQVQLLVQQLAVQRSRLDNLKYERQRVENLVKADAATRKQLDDIIAQIDVQEKEMQVTSQQIAVQRNNIASQNRGILSEGAPLQKRIAQLDDQLQRARIVNPSQGTVITKYAEAGEVISPGKALYKIADLSSLDLRAYINGNQLPAIKLNQPVTVLIDSGENNYREYPGIITWIADKAEFTPKTIQTKEERANLVYAIKVNVKNDGYLKIGMYGEVLLNNKKK
jgi:HlyD family secretion protein